MIVDTFDTFILAFAAGAWTGSKWSSGLHFIIKKE